MCCVLIGSIQYSRACGTGMSKYRLRCIFNLQRLSRAHLRTTVRVQIKLEKLTSPRRRRTKVNTYNIIMYLLNKYM